MDNYKCLDTRLVLACNCERCLYSSFLLDSPITQVWRVFAARFTPAALDEAVAGVMKPMGLAIIMLAAMA